MSSPVQNRLLNLIWFIGLGFLILCCTAGAISKFLYPNTTNISVSIGVLYFIGGLQTLAIILLLKEKWRQKGALLCMLLFVGFALLWNIQYVTGMLFSIFAALISAFVATYKTREIQEKEEDLSTTVELNQLVVETKETESELWMEKANHDDIMKWVFDSDDEKT